MSHNERIIKRWALTRLERRLENCTISKAPHPDGEMIYWNDKEGNMIKSLAPNGCICINLYNKYGELFGGVIIMEGEEDCVCQIDCATPFPESMKFVMATY